MKGLAFIQAVKKAARELSSLGPRTTVVWTGTCFHSGCKEGCQGVIFSWPTEHSSVDRDLSEGTCFHSGCKEGCNGSYLLLAHGTQ